MLSRGIYDALSMWPTVVWPLIFSSAFWAFLRLCQLSQQRHGVSVLNAPWAGPLVLWVYVPLGAVFEIAAHGYLLWVIGWPYAAIAIPIYVLGWMALPLLLDDFAPALVLLPAIHLLFAAALVVLVGFADLAPLRALNSQLYALLAGVHVIL